MKSELKLFYPIKINDKSVSSVSYDPDEITCELFARADAQKLKVTGGATKGVIPGAAELDYSFHLYLGFASIVAVNPDIDFSDLERIKGSDVMEVMKIGRNFIKPKPEGPSEDGGSGGQSGNTPEPTILQLPTSNGDG